MGTTHFLHQYVARKVLEWTEIKILSKFSTTQPHAVYTAFTHGLSSRLNYLIRVTDWEALSASEVLQPLESAIQSQFIPALTGHTPPGDLFREVLALLVRIGGLGLINPVATSMEQHATSKLIIAPLVERVVQQEHRPAQCHAAQQDIKARARSNKHARQEDAEDQHGQLPAPLQRCMDPSKEKGGSIWLTALPIDTHGFALHKLAFRDVLSLRYGWAFENTPSHCSCGHPFCVEHALSCSTGEFPSIRHNEVMDITASMLSKVCHGVPREFHLQPLSGETMSHCSAITDRGTRLDIAVYVFWGSRFEKAFLDVSVFNPCARSNRQVSLPSVYRRHEQKKRQYEQRVRQVENATFTPLVFSTTRGLGRDATTFYRRLNSLLSEKRCTTFSKTMDWVRCRLNFALLRASIMSIRAARSSRFHTALNGIQEPIDLQLAEGHVH